jgi:hypothetical protein
LLAVICNYITIHGHMNIKFVKTVPSLFWNCVQRNLVVTEASWWDR